MAQLSLLFFFAFLLLNSAYADWTVATTETESGTAPGLEHRHLILNESRTAQRATLDLALFSTKSVRLRVFANSSGDDLATVMRRKACLAGINGGYFDLKDQPLGLLISEGKLISPLRKAPLLSGLVVVSDGRLRLLRVAEYSPGQKITEARQCGPFLVDRSHPVAGLNDTRLARRTFVIAGEPDHNALGVSSDTTLAELGRLLATPGIVADLKANRALNLDGGSSTAFWFADEDGAFSVSEQKIVRDFVGLVRNK